MEWKNVRKWLLIMLVVVDVFLAGNLVRQMDANRRAERQALLDAVTVAQRRGITLDAAALLQLPEETESYTAARSEELEQAAADVLLGEGAVPEGPGGGVRIFQKDSGRLSFRRGGALELDLNWAGETPDTQQTYDLLAPAGLAGEDTVIRPAEGGMALTSHFQGLPIVNGELTLQVQEGVLQLRGRCLLGSEPTPTGDACLSRAQMALSLCALLEGEEASGTVTVTAAYYLQGADATALTLVPVWVADGPRGQLILSCITGETMIF